MTKSSYQNRLTKMLTHINWCNPTLLFINLLREEGIETSQVHEDSMLSYYIDYYLAQYNNGNFSQFAWNSKWSKELNEAIETGLIKIGAQKHLELFLEQSEKVNRLTDSELKTFLENEYFGENPIRDSIKNDDFYNLEEDLIVLNSKWLKNHPDLKVLSIDDMFAELEKFIGRAIER